MTLFNKDKISLEEVECAITDLRFEEYNFAQPFSRVRQLEPENEDVSLAKSLFFNNDIVSIDKKEEELLAITGNPSLRFHWTGFRLIIEFPSPRVTLRSELSTTKRVSFLRRVLFFRSVEQKSSKEF